MDPLSQLAEQLPSDAATLGRAIGLVPRSCCPSKAEICAVEAEALCVGDWSAACPTGPARNPSEQKRATMSVCFIAPFSQLIRDIPYWRIPIPTCSIQQPKYDESQPDPTIPNTKTVDCTPVIRVRRFAVARAYSVPRRTPPQNPGLRRVGAVFAQRTLIGPGMPAESARETVTSASGTARIYDT